MPSQNAPDFRLSRFQKLLDRVRSVVTHGKVSRPKGLIKSRLQSTNNGPAGQDAAILRPQGGFSSLEAWADPEVVLVNLKRF